MRSKRLVAGVLCAFGCYGVAHARSLTQSGDLRAGWSAVYPHVDASRPTLDELRALSPGNPVQEIWLCNPAPTTPQKVEVIFRIYDASEAGSVLWAEQQTMTADLYYFGVLLGEGIGPTGEPHPTRISSSFQPQTLSDGFIGVSVKNPANNTFNGTVSATTVGTTTVNATIQGASVAFDGYKGMDDPTANTAAVVFGVGASRSGPLVGLRKHQVSRPVCTTAAFTSGSCTASGQLLASQFTHRRLIGRSGWNSRWELVIPTHNLPKDPHEGVNRFIQAVRDIKLHFVTYS